MGGLRAVQESGQVNITTLNLAIEGLEGIRGQLDGIKRLVVQSQTATAEERDSIQSEIDLSLKQIDATATSTKIGGRTLLDGSTAMKGFADIDAATLTKTDFDVYANGDELGAATGLREVRINKVGTGLPSGAADDGSRILSFQVGIATVATRAELAVALAGAGEYADFRVTGQFGSAVFRVSDDADAMQTSFNALAAETGVTFDGTDLRTVGFGDDAFIKVEFLGGTDGTAADVGGVGGGGVEGQIVTSFATAATANVNGQLVRLGGEFGTTARYLADGYDIEIDFTSQDVFAAGDTAEVRAALNDGVAGLLGASGRSSDVVRYGIGDFTTASLGRANGVTTVTDASGAGTVDETTGSRVLANDSIGNVGSGGPLSLKSARLSDALNTIDRAIGQVVKEQARLGSIQSNFMDAVGRAEVTQGNISAADADIVGVDAAAEITNLVQSQVGVSTATALSSQITAMQQNILSLLRG
jgi:flagellin